MRNVQELEKQLALVEPGDVLDCTVIFKDDLWHVEERYIVIRDASVPDSEVFFYCDGVDDFKRLLQPDNGEDFVVVAFKGRKADYDENHYVLYLADGWTLTLSGCDVGGTWYFDATSPDGAEFSSKKEWRFDDGVPEVPSDDDMVAVAIECLEKENNVALPSAESFKKGNK